MNRRWFISRGTSGLLLTTTHAAWSAEASLPFLALGACSKISNASGIKAAGGEYIEDAVKRLLIPDQPESEWLKILEQVKACPLPIPVCNSFLPGTLKSTGPAVNHEGILEYSEIAFKRGSRIGVKIIVFGSSGSRKIPEGFPREEAVVQFVSLLKKMGPLAQTYGITVAIEPLRRKEDNFINTVLQGGEIVEKVNHPNIRLVSDWYHMLQNGEDPSDLLKVGHLIEHAHIAEKENRSAPGVRGDDFRPFFRAFKQIGYKGRISIEGKWQVDELPKAYQVIREQALSA